MGYGCRRSRACRRSAPRRSAGLRSRNGSRTAAALRRSAKRAHRRGGAPAVARAGDGGRAARKPSAARRGTRYTAMQRACGRGFLPLEGGHRLGLCGTAVAENGSVTGVRRISSLNLRVARQIDALDDIIAPYIGEGAPFSLLVLAPPGCGKTTLVREWVRLVSDAGHTTAVADERGEIAGLAEGVPQFRIGRCTDILEGCTKKAGGAHAAEDHVSGACRDGRDHLARGHRGGRALRPLRHGGARRRACSRAQRPAAQTALPAAAVARRVRAGADDRAEGRETKLSNGENGGTTC